MTTNSCIDSIFCTISMQFIILALFAVAFRFCRKTILYEIYRFLLAFFVMLDIFVMLSIFFIVTIYAVAWEMLGIKGFDAKGVISGYVTFITLPLSLISTWLITKKNTGPVFSRNSHTLSLLINKPNWNAKDFLKLLNSCDTKWYANTVLNLQSQLRKIHAVPGFQLSPAKEVKFLKLQYTLEIKRIEHEFCKQLSACEPFQISFRETIKLRNIIRIGIAIDSQSHGDKILNTWDLAILEEAINHRYQIY